MWVADKVEKKKTEELNVYSTNARVHTEQQINQIANAISEWGWTIPILIDEDNTVLAGHGRLTAAKSLSIDEVPCIVARGWSEAQKKAYVIADNKLAENSEWNTDVYFSELKELSSIGFDLTLAGFDDDLKFSFQPNLSPTANLTEVTGADIENATKSIYEQFMGAGQEAKTGEVDVICPECGHDFKVSGY